MAIPSQLMTMAPGNIAEARVFFKKSLEEIWKEETDMLFFIWWNEKKGWTRSEIQTNANYILNEAERKDFSDAIERLKLREPIQYIIGSVPFAGCRISVNENVLIPRPETEEMVYFLQSKMIARSECRILDLCTGSGCIALGLSKLLPYAYVRGADVSEKAVETAVLNNLLNSLEVEFVAEDVFYPRSNDESWDLIVSNPPYVLHSESWMMNENVLNFEPHLALFVEDEDPLLFYRVIIENYGKSIIQGGILAFEINENHSHGVMNLIRNSRLFGEPECHYDLQGKARMMLALKNDK